MNEIKIILGLGNPKKNYKNTYHNLGHIFLDWLKEKWNYPPFKKEENLLAEVSFLKGKDILLAKNLTFMNEAYKTVKALKEKFKYQIKNFLIVHDDSDIFLNQFKISFNKSSAGHKGIEPIIKNFGRKFYRVRIGIRKPEEKIRQKAKILVLRNISKEEKLIFLKLFEEIERKILEIF